jgi:hypothetical protein
MDYFDFEILLKKNGNDIDYYVKFNHHFPEKAKEYLVNYINKTKKYKNFYNFNKEIRFSLYQPALNSMPGKRYLYFRLLRKFEYCRILAVVTFGITKKCQCRCKGFCFAATTQFYISSQGYVYAILRR